jgi:putative oxidoreductase
MHRSENTATLIGRVLLSLLFILGGWGKLLGPAATQAMLAGHNLPMVQAAWVLAVVVELGGGLASFSACSCVRLVWYWRAGAWRLL